MRVALTSSHSRYALCLRHRLGGTFYCYACVVGSAESTGIACCECSSPFFFFSWQSQISSRHACRQQSPELRVVGRLLGSRPVPGVGKLATHEGLVKSVSSSCIALSRLA